jgi:hypothetical protein
MSKSRDYQIKRKLSLIQDMLIQKNRAYGSSALEPLNIFSKGKATNSLCSRIDDKLARIQNVGISDETEDTLFDLVGYLVLLMISIDDNEKKDI